MKELEIVKMYQKHLSNILEGKLAKEKQQAEESLFSAFDPFESFGVCILDETLKMLSFNTTFKNFASEEGAAIPDSQISRQMRKVADALSKIPDLSKMGPVSVEIDGNTYLIEVSRYRQSNTKYICIAYSLSNYFLKSMIALRDQYRLSKREMEILYLMLKNGMTNEEIARHLFISAATVKRHIATAYQKIGINNQKQLLTMLKIL